MLQGRSFLSAFGVRSRVYEQEFAELSATRAETTCSRGFAMLSPNTMQCPHALTQNVQEPLPGHYSTQQCHDASSACTFEAVLPMPGPSAASLTKVLILEVYRAQYLKETFLVL